MASIFWRVPFADKNVAQVSTTLLAGNLGSAAVGIGCLHNSAWDFLIKAWPTAARVKFAVRSIERGVTPTALVGALNEKILIFASKRGFGAFVNDNSLFLGGKFIHVHTSISLAKSKSIHLQARGFNYQF